MLSVESLKQRFTIGLSVYSHLSRQHYIGGPPPPQLVLERYQQEKEINEAVRAGQKEYKFTGGRLRITAKTYEQLHLKIPDLLRVVWVVLDCLGKTF